MSRDDDHEKEASAWVDAFQHFACTGALLQHLDAEDAPATAPVAPKRIGWRQVGPADQGCEVGTDWCHLSPNCDQPGEAGESRRGEPGKWVPPFGGTFQVYCVSKREAEDGLWRVPVYEAQASAPAAVEWEVLDASHAGEVPQADWQWLSLLVGGGLEMGADSSGSMGWWVPVRDVLRTCDGIPKDAFEYGWLRRPVRVQHASQQVGAPTRVCSDWSAQEEVAAVLRWEQVSAKDAGCEHSPAWQRLTYYACHGGEPGQDRAGKAGWWVPHSTWRINGPIGTRVPWEEAVLGLWRRPVYVGPAAEVKSETCSGEAYSGEPTRIERRGALEVAAHGTLEVVMRAPPREWTMRTAGAWGRDNRHLGAGRWTALADGRVLDSDVGVLALVRRYLRAWRSEGERWNGSAFLVYIDAERAAGEDAVLVLPLR